MGRGIVGAALHQIQHRIQSVVRGGVTTGLNSPYSDQVRPYLSLFSNLFELKILNIFIGIFSMPIHTNI